MFLTENNAASRTFLRKAAMRFTNYRCVFLVLALAAPAGTLAATTPGMR